MAARSILSAQQAAAKLAPDHTGTASSKPLRLAPVGSLTTLAVVLRVEEYSCPER